jgi:hypothetical protein
VTASITAACAVAYFTCWAWGARWWYRRIRPWTEPIACESPKLHTTPSLHFPCCYFRWWQVGNNGTAMGFAVMLGMLGPLALVGVCAGQAVRWIVASGDRELAAEVAAKNERLERELGIGDR